MIRRTGHIRRHRWAGPVEVVGTVLAGLLGAAVVSGPAARAGGAANSPAQIAALINGVRQAQGLGRLGLDPGLTSVAQRWADVMAGAQAIFNDTALSGATGWSVMGENVGASTSGAAAEAGFENSPSHLDNILYAGYSAVGIGVADAGGTVYVVEDFAGAGGPPAAAHLKAPAVGMAGVPGGGGYWVVAADGGVFTFGGARFFGSTGALHLAAPIVGMAATPDGGGYWLVAADGGIFTFGDARFLGSAGGVHLSAPIVGMSATRDGGGYWLVGSNGALFSFGDARNLGTVTGAGLVIVGMAADSAAPGYWLLTSGGWILPFGAAPYLGSAPEQSSAVGMAASPDGGGYWVAYGDGTVATFGDAPRSPDDGALLLDEPMVGVAGSAVGSWTVERSGSVFAFGGPYLGGA